MQIGPCLCGQALLQELPQTELFHVQREQVVVSIRIFKDFYFLVQLVDHRSVSTGALCQLAPRAITVRDVRLESGVFPIVEIVIVASDIGVIPCLCPFVESLHPVSQSIGIFLYD
jgi:hypothetical protein